MKFYGGVRGSNRTSDKILVVTQITMLTVHSEIWPLLNKLLVNFDIFQDSSTMISGNIAQIFGVIWMDG